MPEIIANSLEVAKVTLTIFVTVEAIFFGIYGVLYSLFSTYILKAEGAFPEVAHNMRDVCNAIKWLITLNAALFVFNLIVVLFIENPGWIISLILIIGVSISAISIPIITFWVSRFMGRRIS